MVTHTWFLTKNILYNLKLNRKFLLTVAMFLLVFPATRDISRTGSKIGALSFTSFRFTVIVKGLEDFGSSFSSSLTKTRKLSLLSLGGSLSKLG